MNKLLFHEGGQPIVLDDIKMLQDNPQNQFQALLNVLTGGESTFLMYPLKTNLVSAEPGRSVFTTAKNWLVENGVIYPLPETTLTVATWYESLYIGIRRANTDVRVFEDGQENACREVGEAYLTLEKTEGVYDIAQLKSFFELLSPLVVERSSQVAYQNIPVTFLNGYTGEVKFIETGGCYRVRLYATSSRESWESDKLGQIFQFNKDTPIWLNGCVSPRFMLGSRVNEVWQECNIVINHKVAELDSNFIYNSFPPERCSFHVYFEIPIKVW